MQALKGQASCPRRGAADGNAAALFNAHAQDSMSPPPAAPATPATLISGASDLDDARYRELSAAALAKVEATCDRWLQEDVVDIDTHRSGGLLELVLPNGSKLILNTQPPLKELWLAAKGGGFHFRWVSDRWVDTRDGVELFERLSALASNQAGLSLRF
jgi:CyaY protein